MRLEPMTTHIKEPKRLTKYTTPSKSRLDVGCRNIGLSTRSYRDPSSSRTMNKPSVQEPTVDMPTIAKLLYSYLVLNIEEFSILAIHTKRYHPLQVRH